MKSLILSVALLIVAMCVVSCGDDELKDTPIDPKLNLTEYTFDASGGTLVVYSTINMGISVERKMEIYDLDPKEMLVDTTFQAAPGEPVYEGWYGGWYRAYYPYKLSELPDNKYRTMICIEVEPNETGEERKLPITIIGFLYDCKVNLRQEK